MICNDIQMTHDIWNSDDSSDYFKSIILISKIVESDPDFLLDQLAELKLNYVGVTDKHFQIILQIRADLSSKQIIELIEDVNSYVESKEKTADPDDPFVNIIFDNQLITDSVKNEWNNLSRRVTKLQSKTNHVMKKEITTVKQAATEVIKQQQAAIRKRRESLQN